MTNKAHLVDGVLKHVPRPLAEDAFVNDRRDAWAVLVEGGSVPLWQAMCCVHPPEKCWPHVSPEAAFRGLQITHAFGVIRILCRRSSPDQPANSLPSFAVQEMVLNDDGASLWTKARSRAGSSAEDCFDVRVMLDFAKLAALTNREIDVMEKERIFAPELVALARLMRAEAEATRAEAVRGAGKAPSGR